jgi:large subunit ribosomal protein L6
MAIIKMTQEKSSGKETLLNTLEIPEGITATYSDAVFEISGPKGSVKKKIIHPKILFRIEGNKINVYVKGKYTQREKKLLFTYRAIIKNFFKGVTEGHIYKLKACSGHFPMTVTVKDKKFEIKNLLGETIPRTMAVQEGADIKVDGNIITVQGPDKYLVSQTAANIETLARRPGFDKRIYMDGIWIIEKDGKPIK